MGGREIGGAVVGEQALDRDPVAPVEAERTFEKADRRLLALVLEYLGVGEPAVVVDADVDALVADLVAANAFQVGLATVVLGPALAAEGAFAGAALDPAEALDVDVHELAGTLSLVAD